MIFGNSARRSVLLTGAGFTANFGGPLASQLWARILNRCQAAGTWPTLRFALLNSFDFEAVYSKVVTEDIYTSDEKRIIRQAIVSVYEDLDRQLAEEGVVWSSTSIDPQGFHNFINSFAGDRKGGNGFIFTLNQDMLLERVYYDLTERSPLRLPGVRQVWPDIHKRVHTVLKREDYVALGRSSSLESDLEDELLDKAHRLYYLKLHGSQNWLSSDGSQRMVIGRAKQDQIAAEPILDWYFRVFERVLYAGDVRLLVCGYGFSDEHINKVIDRALTECGLRLYVLSPESPSTWFANIAVKNDCKHVFGGLHGYFEARLSDVFPSSGRRTAVWQDIQNFLTV